MVKKRRTKAGGHANDGNSVSDEELAMLKDQLFQAISEIFPFLQHATDLGIHEGIPELMMPCSPALEGSFMLDMKLIPEKNSLQSFLG